MPDVDVEGQSEEHTKQWRHSVWPGALFRTVKKHFRAAHIGSDCNGEALFQHVAAIAQSQGQPKQRPPQSTVPPRGKASAACGPMFPAHLRR